MKLGLLFYLFANCIASATEIKSFVHKHPGPLLPTILDPARAGDVFSNSAIFQIHSTLFEIKNNLPVPNIVKSFSVSADQLEYSIELKPLSFHSGAILSAYDVRYSLERSISLKAGGSEKLANILGYRIKGEGRKPIKLSGIVIDRKNNLKFKIHLKKADPNLIFSLTEFRFSILPRNGNIQDGLGPYKVKEFNTDHLLLEKNDKRKSTLGPDLVEFIRVSDKEEAMAGFLSGKFHDLWAYSLDRNDINSLAQGSNVETFQSPRVYLLILNTNRIPSVRIRDAVLSHVNQIEIISKCYPGRLPIVGMIPSGFVGSISKSEIPTSQKSVLLSGKVRNLRIQIANGVGSEKCIKEIFEKSFLNKVNSLNVTVRDTDQIINSWIRSEIDAMFVYLEPENTLDYFYMFNPNSNLTFGPQNDPVLKSLIDRFNQELRLPEKDRIGKELNQRILSQKIVLPIFTPQQFLVTSKIYKRIHPVIQASTFIRFNQLEFQR